MNFDPNTGQPINNNYQQPVVKKENTMAVIAIVLAALGFNVISLILGILGLKKSKETNSGKGLSIAAIIISILQILVIIFIVAVGTMFTNLVWPSVKKEIVNQATCTMAYDCELNTKSEYICKYKDENNEEKEIKCPWTDVNTDQQKTTIAQNTPNLSDIKVESLKKFAELGSKFKDKYDASSYGIILTDNSFKKLDEFYNDDEDCTPTGTNNKNGLSVSYTCKKDSGDEDQYYGWFYDITVNDKFHIQASESTCGKPLYYFGENTYIVLHTSCAVTGSYLSIRDSNNNVLYENEDIAYPSFNQEDNYINFITGEEEKSYYINPYIENNKLYFVYGKENNTDNDTYGNNECYTMEYDLTTNKLNKIDTFKCYYRSDN